MIDRSYLPFASARAYLDRGMAKWMGFFLSEHSTALDQGDTSIDESGQMPLDQLALLLGQAYVQGLDLLVYTRQQREAYQGRVYDLSPERIYLQTPDQVLALAWEDLIRLQAREEAYEK